MHKTNQHHTTETSHEQEALEPRPTALQQSIISGLGDFYSAQLSTQIKKGNLRKAEAGGTLGRTPLGYHNTVVVDDSHQPTRSVEIDSERGRHITWAFERFAQDDITVAELLAKVTEQGLTTRPGPTEPSKPLAVAGLNRLLRNPYYRGQIVHDGQVYHGAHQPLIDPTTWEKVQELLTPPSQAKDGSPKLSRMAA